MYRQIGVKSQDFHRKSPPDSPIFPIRVRLSPMRNLTAFLCLTFAVLLFSAGEGFALPPCPEDPNQRFHNCFGTYTFANGDKYVGEFRDDKYHGQGTLTFGDGRVLEGVWKNNEFQYARKDLKIEERRKAERETERRKQERIA